MSRQFHEWVQQGSVLIIGNSRSKRSFNGGSTPAPLDTVGQAWRATLTENTTNELPSIGELKQAQQTCNPSIAIHVPVSRHESGAATPAIVVTISRCHNVARSKPSESLVFNSEN
jgi:hypothetical protein